jgi:starch synthase (maltosyl-transferring)
VQVSADRSQQPRGIGLALGPGECFAWLSEAAGQIAGTALETARRFFPGFDALTRSYKPLANKPLPPPESPKVRARPVIEGVTPNVEGGRFPSKRELGDELVVEADVFADGHDELACELRWRHQDDRRWSSAPMRSVGNDRWQGEFRAERLGTYEYSVHAVIDRYSSWVRDLRARIDAGQAIDLELLVGAVLLEELAEDAQRADQSLMIEVAEQLRKTEVSWEPVRVLELASVPELLAAARRGPIKIESVSSAVLRVGIDRERARFSSWYEMFPRSTSTEPGRHGTLRDAASLLPYVAELGFDVLYLPPIHPIGRTNRKGPDGAPVASIGDPGSPWAIGAAEGGHCAVHPELGDLEDLDRLVEDATAIGIEVALDLAFQCSPDHPWVTEHPNWFKALPDGSIRYAENPPKRYEDIYPIDFDTPDWKALWEELAGVVHFWIDHGIRIFRVDNPHTKPLQFWEWLISSVKAEHPDVLFLSEAFTRPKVMARLAKLGFSQSYTYFAWRNAKWELEQYLNELHGAPMIDFFRPNLWPNTPDILTEQLQNGGRATFVARVVLAATLASSYGIYGPPYELQESRPRNLGSEEYLHSEKYEVRHWKRDDENSLAPLIASLNRTRRDNPALQHDGNLHFHHVDNDNLIAYSRRHADNTILVVVNLDPVYTQSGWIDLDLRALGSDGARAHTLFDTLTGSLYAWDQARNFVSLDPRKMPAHVFRIAAAEDATGVGSVRSGSPART